MEFSLFYRRIASLNRIIFIWAIKIKRIIYSRKAFYAKKEGAFKILTRIHDEKIGK